MPFQCMDFSPNHSSINIYKNKIQIQYKKLLVDAKQKNVCRKNRIYPLAGNSAKALGSASPDIKVLLDDPSRRATSKTYNDIHDINQAIRERERSQNM